MNTNELLLKTGRAFYGIGIIAYGVQQIVIKDFRPEIVPVFPAWAHNYAALPYITGAAMIIVGAIITGLFPVKAKSIKAICLYLGFYFLALILCCHIPYNLFISPNKPIHVGVWVQALKETAYCGGALVMAGSFSENSFTPVKNNFFTSLLEKLIPWGKVFFSITMIMFGYAHFLYTDYISTMVPGWFGMPYFWTYLGGAALIASGVAIIIWVLPKVVSYLLAAMIFLWFIFLHVPDAIAHPTQANGNEIVSAFDALLFSGIALVIANSRKPVNQVGTL